MKRLPLSGEYKAKLYEYGLQKIPETACFCLQASPGEELLQEGQPILWLFLVVSGSAKVCRTAPNGKSLILCFYVSEGIIGEVELLTGQKAAGTTVAALTDIECVAVSYRHCMEELKSNVLFLGRLGAELALKLSRSSDNLVSSVLYSGEQRLCSYILRASPRGLFHENLTEVSFLIGLSYRHMFRLLGQLCADGILEKRESGYCVKNREELIRRSHMPDDFINLER